MQNMEQPGNPNRPSNYFQHMKPEHVQAMGLELMGVTWKEALKEEFKKTYFAKRLASFVEEERKNGDVYPSPEEVFNWTKHCRIDEVKAVIVGQDPYHGKLPPQGGGKCIDHGYAFSIRKPGKAKGSLRNIFRVLKKNYPEFQDPGHGDLTGWAEQGVVLLNAVLTVRDGEAGSHRRKGWETFTDAVIQRISSCNDGVVFMLWGKSAQKKRVWIDEDMDHHLVLTSSHPSQLSVERTNERFSECEHFVKTNNFLSKKGKREVDWNLRLEERKSEKRGQEMDARKKYHSDVSDSEQPPAASNSRSQEQAQNRTSSEQEPLLDNGHTTVVEMSDPSQREQTERSVVDQPSSTLRNELWHCLRKCDLKTFLRKIPQPYFGLIYVGLFLWVLGDIIMDIFLSAPATGKYSLIIERFRAVFLAVGILLSWPLLLLYPKMAWAKERENEDELNALLRTISKYDVLHAAYESIPQCCISLFIFVNEGSFHALDVVRIIISLMIAVMIICKFLADSSAKSREKFNVLNYGFCETMCLVIVFTPFPVHTHTEKIQDASDVWVAYFAYVYIVLWRCVVLSAALVPIGFHSSSFTNLDNLEKRVADQYCSLFMFSAVSMIKYGDYLHENTFVFVISTIIFVVYIVLKVGLRRDLGMVTFVVVVTLFCLIAGAVMLAISYFTPKIFDSVIFLFDIDFLIFISASTIIVVVRHNFPGFSRSIAARLKRKFSS